MDVQDDELNGRRVVDQPSRSFLVAFPALLARHWAQAACTLVDAGDNSASDDMTPCPFHMTSHGGYGYPAYLSNGSPSGTVGSRSADSQGIVIGTGTAAVVPDDNALQTQIRSGEDATEIMYFGTAIYGLTIDTGADTASFTVEALFKNMSGGSITVNEVGIYANGEGGSIYKFCIIRDKLASGQAVADGEYLKVTYTISIAS
jgi:hypothetical protein